tara:strand:+ start:87 stop:431 length:345 start_codon:yes stop_codon:yes gene_type:complete
MKTLDIVETIYFGLLERKAEDITILDMSKVSSVADYFVLAHTNSERGVRALADSILKELKDELSIRIRVEGLSDGDWIVLDLGDILIHIFHKKTRAYFQLESLWEDASIIHIGE